MDSNCKTILTVDGIVASGGGLLGGIGSLLSAGEQEVGRGEVNVTTLWDCLGTKGHTADGSHVGFRTKHEQRDSYKWKHFDCCSTDQTWKQLTQRAADFAHFPQTFLIVGTGTSNENGNIVLDELLLEFSQSRNDTAEGSCHVGKVGNTSTGDEHLALWVLWAASHQAKNSLGILVGLLLGWSPTVFAVVGQFGGATQITNGIGINNTSTTTGHHRPYPAISVQDGELQRSTALCVQIGNVGLFRIGITSEWRRVVNLSPLGTAHEIGGGIDLGCQIQNVDGALCHDQGVNFQIGKVQVYIKFVQIIDKTGDSPEKWEKVV